MKGILQRILQRILQEIMKKNNTCNIRRLVNETIVPSTHRPSVPVYYIEDCRILEQASKATKYGAKSP